MGNDRSREVNLAVRRVLQAGREMQAAVAAGMGVRTTDVQAIDHVISADEPMGTVELGDRLGIRSASAAALVDRLVETDHLRREPHPTDGRRVSLAVTEHARAQVRQALEPLLTDIAGYTRQLNDDQADTVLDFLDHVITAMRNYAVEAKE